MTSEWGVGQKHPDVSRVLLTADALAEEVRQLGRAISADYADRSPLLIGILKGVVPFLADLVRAITIPCSLDFLAISSFGSPSRSGNAQILKDLDSPIEGRDVVIVEDIVDTGLTLHYLARTLRQRRPASLVICTLLDRPRRRLVSLPIAYRGFEMPDDFIVGYGLDYRELYRNLPYIGILRSELYHAS
jgi:hypoxanthine phosphoribosyltransferase